MGRSEHGTKSYKVHLSKKSHKGTKNHTFEYMFVVKVECDHVLASIEVEARNVSKNTKKRRRLVEFVANESTVASLMTCSIAIGGEGPKWTNRLLSPAALPTINEFLHKLLPVTMIFSLARWCSNDQVCFVLSEEMRNDDCHLFSYINMARLEFRGDVNGGLISIEDRVDIMTMLPAQSTHTIFRWKVYCSLFESNLVRKDIDTPKCTETRACSKLDDDIEDVRCDRVKDDGTNGWGNGDEGEAVAKGMKGWNRHALIDRIKEIRTTNSVYKEGEVISVIAIAARLVTLFNRLLNVTDNRVDASSIPELDLK